MFDFIIKYWVQFLFGTIVSALGVSTKYLHSKIKKDIAERKLIKIGLLAILHSDLYKICGSILSRGDWITVDEMDNIEHLWEGYHGLGGNGTGEAMYMRCKNTLKIVPNGYKRPTR